MGPVVPGSCTQQALPGTTAVLEAAAGCVPPAETGPLEKAEEDFPPAQTKPGPFVAWVPEVQVP